MNVYIITACYNYKDVLYNYINSLNEAISRSIVSDRYKYYINPFVVFINDDPSLMGYLDEVLSTGIAMFHYRILENETNLGVSRSRNKGLKYILETQYSGVITYFDVDDTWMPNAVSDMYSICDMVYNGNNLVFSPVDNGRPLVEDIISNWITMPNFLTKVPMQECIYFWSWNYAWNFYKKYGFLWYEDDSESKYFPEDIMFHMDLSAVIYITPKIICKRDYAKGNITKDWDGTIRNNRSAFKKLIEMHEYTSKLVDYPSELIEYVDYLKGIVNDEISNNK